MSSSSQETLRRQGAKAVFFGRYTALLRALIPGAAGMSGVPSRTFVLWNVLGGITWATAFVLLGYLAGTQYESVEHYANWFALAMLGLIGVVLWRRHRRGTHAA